MSVEIQSGRFKITLSGRNVVHLLLAVAAFLAIIAARRSMLALAGAILCGVLAWVLKQAKGFQDSPLLFEQGLVRSGPNEAVSQLGYKVRRFQEQLQYSEGERVLTVPLAPKLSATQPKTLGFFERGSAHKNAYSQFSELAVMVSLPDPATWDPPNQGVALSPQQAQTICQRISSALMFLDLER